MTASERKEKLEKLVENYIKYHCYSDEEKYMCKDYFYWKAYLFGFCDALDYDVYSFSDFVTVRDSKKNKTIVNLYKGIFD